jgi:uncharacterized protein YuzE
MKTLTIITMFLAMLAKDPTPAIQQFVSTYFPKATILFTQRDDGEYEVRLSDGTEIDFTRKGEWKNIDCKHSNIYTSVPAELVPEQISTYVKTNFASQSIIKIEKKRRSWEIELSSELEIKFDKRFNVTKIDD